MCGCVLLAFYSPAASDFSFGCLFLFVSQLFISARYGAVQRLRMFIELDILFLLVTKPSHTFMFNHNLFNRRLTYYYYDCLICK